MTLRGRRCECGAADCSSVISISHEEQDAVDHDPRNLWIVAPGHDLLGAHSVKIVERFVRYTVVEAQELT